MFTGKLSGGSLLRQGFAGRAGRNFPWGPLRGNQPAYVKTTADRLYKDFQYLKFIVSMRISGKEVPVRRSPDMLRDEDGTKYCPVNKKALNTP